MSKILKIDKIVWKFTRGHYTVSEFAAVLLKYLNEEVEGGTLLASDINAAKINRISARRRARRRATRIKWRQRFKNKIGETTNGNY